MIATTVPEGIRNIADYATAILAIATLIGLISTAVVKPLRQWLLRRIKTAQTWLTQDLTNAVNAMQTELTNRRQISEDLVTQVREIPGIKDKVDRMHYAVFNDNQNGVLQQLARLTGRLDTEFENAPYPAMEMDWQGAVGKVTRSLRKLLGVTDAKELMGFQWEAYLHGDHAEDFKRQKDVSFARGENFIGVCDLVDPRTGDDRGRWQISAHMIPVGVNRIYYCKLTVALNRRAAELVEELRLDVEVASAVAV